MKILLVNSLYSDFVKGGAEKSVKYLAEQMFKLGMEVTVLSVTNKTTFHKVENGVKVRYLRNRNLYWAFDENERKKLVNRFLKYFWHVIELFNIFQYFNLKRIIIEENPTLIHTNNLAGFSPIVWLIGKLLKIPVVHTMRDYSLICVNSNMLKNDKKCKGQCNVCKLLTYPKKYQLRYVSHIVGISEFILHLHSEVGFLPSDLPKQVIYNQIEASEFPSEELCRNEVLTFGFIGRIAQHKGLEDAFRAFCSVKSNKVRFVVAGDGDEDYISYLKNTYKDERILYLGHVHPQDFFKRITLLIIPSKWNEPFGRVILEAYQYGIPVIGAANGAIPELVENGKTGFLYYDVSQLLKILTDASLGYLPKLEREEINKKLNFFQGMNIAKEYKKLYMKVIE